MIFVLGIFYFLTDISSLPQDVFYIWSTTTNVNLYNTWHQLVSFGLPFANVAGIIWIVIVITLNGFDLKVNQEFLMPFIP